MALSLSIAKVTGIPDASGWAQIHDFSPEDPREFTSHGRLMAVVATTQSENKGGIEQVRLGREILALLHKEYFSKTGSPLILLKKACEVINIEFGQEQVELGIVAYIDGIAYVAGMGGARIALFRKGTLVTLVGGEEIKTASGRLQDKDVLLVETECFRRLVPQGVVKGFLETGNITTFAETVTPLVRGRDNSGCMAAMVIQCISGESAGLHEPVSETGRKPSGLRMRLARVIDSVLARLPERRIRVQTDAVDIEQNKNKRKLPFVGILLLILLALSIGFGFRQHAIRTERAQYEEELSRAEHEYEEARSLAGLNTARARELILASRDTALSLRERNINDPRLLQLEEKIAESMGAIAGIYQEEPQLFLDLSLVSSGFTGEKIAMSRDRMLVLDARGRKLTSIAVASKRTEVVTGPDYLPDAIDVAAYTNRNFILSRDGIREIGDEVELVVRQEWNPDTILFEAFSGNLYILDRDANTIYRHSGTLNGFAEKTTWIAPGITVGVDDAVSWAIDGSVWILHENGLSRLDGGVPRNIVVEGVDFTGMEDIFTDEDYVYVYFLDTQNKRIVVVNKDGNYKGEYQAESLGGASQIVVSESEKKLLFLSDGKLFSIEMKHLE